MADRACGVARYRTRRRDGRVFRTNGRSDKEEVVTQGLAGQKVVVLGGSYGIGLATAWRARTAGASVVLTSRDPDRLATAATVVGTAITGAVHDIDGGEQLIP